MGNAHINANGFLGDRFNRRTNLTGKTGIPSIDLSFDSAGFDFSLNRSVEFYFNNSDFGELETFIGEREPRLLRISKTMVSITRFIPWIASSAIFCLEANKEKCKSFLYSEKNILKDLRVNLSKVNILTFSFFKEFLLFYPGKPFGVFLVVFSSLGKSIVV